MKERRTSVRNYNFTFSMAVKQWIVNRFCGLYLLLNDHHSIRKFLPEGPEEANERASKSSRKRNKFTGFRTWRNVPNRPMAGDISKKRQVGRRMALEFYPFISSVEKVLNFWYKTLLWSKIHTGCERGKAWSIFPLLLSIFRTLLDKCHEFSITPPSIPYVFEI